MGDRETGEPTRVSGSWDCAGPAEVVFGVLTDPDRAVRWLPHAESATTRSVAVRRGGSTEDYRVETDPEHLRVRWSGGGGHGTAHVEDAPAGGSVVHAEVTVPAGDGDAATVRQMLDETVRGLRSDVSDSFNAG